MPAALNRWAASVMEATSPESATWSGALWLATTTESPQSAISLRTSSTAADTAHIAPSVLAAACAINTPRARAIRRASSSLKTPAAHKALTSPKLCPPTATGVMPRARITASRLKLCAPMPGCAHSVFVRSAACCARSSSVNAVFGQTTWCRSRSAFRSSARPRSHAAKAGSKS